MIPPPATHTVPAALITGNTAFACDLFRQLSNEPGNLFVSPYSISTALAMTYAGAAGNTAAEMARVLHFELEDAALHPAFDDLDATLQRHLHGSQLSIANALYPGIGCQLLASFLATMQEHYHTQVTPIDYSDSAAAREQINAWVAQVTAGKIRDLLKPSHVTPLTVLILVNAIYFKGHWQQQFDASRTRQRQFQGAHGNVEVPMMTQRAIFNYAEFEGLQLLELPYAGQQLSMVVILPQRAGDAVGSGNNLARVEAQLSPARLESWISDSQPTEVEVLLPRFTLRSRFDLNTVLEQLGMRDAFGPADFSGINGMYDLFISAVVHQAFVNVNEEGSEAAAATAVVVSRSVPPPAPIFCADHPFLFLIRDRGTGTILFLGHLTAPE